MTRNVEAQTLSSWRTALLLAALMAVIVVTGGVAWWLWEGLPGSRATLQDMLLKGLVCWVLLVAMAVLAWQVMQRTIGRLVSHAYRWPFKSDTKAAPPKTDSEAANYLRGAYGPFWRRKVRLLLIVGEPDQVGVIAPGLVAQKWLVGQSTVLLHGGSLLSEQEQNLLAQWQALTLGRGLDGIVWALSNDQSNDTASVSIGVCRLQNLARDLRWQLPLHLWQVCSSQWSQHPRSAQPVGCLLPRQLTAAQLDEHLQRLQPPLREQGLAHIQKNLGHDFLLRLSRDLQAEGTARWRTALSDILGTRGVFLRGLWFSLAVQQKNVVDSGHHWHPDPAWLGVLGDKAANSQRLGWSAPRVGYAVALTLAALWGAGLLLSFVSNRAQVAHVQASLTSLQLSPGTEQPLQALSELVRELARLDYRADQGAPWYQGFGLDQSQALRDALWPHYVQANHALLRDPAVAQLQSQLAALVKLAPDSPERVRRARDAYDQLKAYLMLARPDKADAAFLVETLGKAEPTLWQFYGQQLSVNPGWAIEPHPRLVAQVRQVLLGQLGQRNAEASLYRQALESAANHYPAMNLQQMVGDTDATALFTTGASVPGVFTRQAWEGQVRAAIDDAAKARREEIDWVLSDNPTDIAAELRPEELKERLTARYFEDYSRAWMDFLNSLRWQQSDSLAEVIEQLTLMSDVRQSPLIALMNTLAYQGQAGVRGVALTDSLIKSAQTLVAQDKVAVIDPLPQGPSGPLDATFGPLLAVLGKGPEGQGGNSSLSLQAFLTRVTGVRLKLQQISSAPDPQAMTQALAQTVFQGKQVDLTDTRSFGSLIAASLGAQWGGIAQTLFVQPLDQAWQRVLQPSAAALNSQWQRAIVNEWHGAFAGRYPFVATASDASLPMLGQMIRAESGRIEQFLQQQLAGLLRKEGSRWVADPRHSQGLRFNPQFLTAINQLSHLADVLYTDGGMGLSFELQGKPVRDVVQTTFILNGERHQYFNQRESWQRFRWPGHSDYPGTRLSWTSVHTGERLLGDYQGTWGLIRLLEEAQVTPLDDGDSRFRLVLEAPDGLGLTWNLRTELGAGPLAMLTLRDFTLPKQIFLAEGDSQPSYAQAGSAE